MINIAAMPGDRYGRYTKLKKELIKATGTADYSQDNLDALLACLEVAIEHYGYKVVKKVEKPTKFTKPKSTPKL